MLEPLVALGILAGQQDSADAAPREEMSAVVETVSAAPQGAAEFAVDEKQMPRSLYLPYD
jgi:hypothetical protein